MNFDLYDLILKDFEKKNNDTKNIIATATIAPLTERRDGSSVFEEGREFAEVEKSGEAEAYLTMVAAPHVPPTLRLTTFIDSATRILNQKPGLPTGIDEVEKISPQIMVWWRDEQGADDGRMDMPLLGIQNEDKISRYVDVISRQTIKALKILNDSVDDNSTIWGCWGHATPEERRHSGLGRGAPTNKHGHLHITYFDNNRTDMEVQSHFPIEEKINHFKPLSAIFHDLFGTELAKQVEHSFGEGLRAESIQERTVNQGASSFNYGYEVVFENPISINEVLVRLSFFASVAEKEYKNMRSFYEQYHQCVKGQERDTLVENFLTDCNKKGINGSFAKNLVNLMRQIHPTLTQLLAWRAELIRIAPKSEEVIALGDAISKYISSRSRLSKTSTRTFMDIVTEDEGAQISELDKVRFVWPEHASFFYTIDDYVLDGDLLKVRKIKIFPSLGSTESAVEYKTATILRRPN